MTTRELHLPSRAGDSRDRPRDRASCAGLARRIEDGQRTGQDVAGILQTAYRPFDRAADLVRSIADALVEHKKVPVIDARVAPDTARVRPARPVPDIRIAAGAAAWIWPLAYRDRVLGELLVDRSAAEGGEAHDTFRQALCRAVGRLLHRYEVRAMARARLGRDLWFVGIAPALRMLEARIEEVSVLAMPLLIDAEFGCETTTAALAVHAAGRPSEPFRELRCGEMSDAGAFRTSLEAVAGDVARGTLFLKDVDELDARCQKELVEFLERSSRTGMPLLFGAAPPTPPFRLVASTSRGLGELAEAGGLSRRLWSVLDYLRVRIPALRERREDIPRLLDYYGARVDPADPRTFSRDASAILSAWHWSGNLAELERMMARLIATTRSSIIDADHLSDWAAELMPAVPGGGDGPVAADLEAPAVADESEADGEPSASPPVLPSVVLARQLLDGRFDDIHVFHPGLQRALRWLAEHFQEEIALEHLARESFVSQSYLCALFKKGVGTGFKRFQSILRVEKAKQLLVHNRHDRITDISLEVGFGDFSHFLKTFKRIIHVSPREFRKRHAEARDVDRPA